MPKVENMNFPVRVLYLYVFVQVYVSIPNVLTFSIDFFHALTHLEDEGEGEDYWSVSPAGAREYLILRIFCYMDMYKSHCIQNIDFPTYKQ